MPHHKIIDLSSQNIEKIPNYIFDITELEELNLSNNKINTIPNSIGKLKNLKKLNLYNNKIRSLPKQFFSLENLTSIDLGNNNILNLSNDISRLSKLRELLIENNKIKKLPSSISKLELLSDIWLKNNPLIEPPFEIAQLGIDQIISYFNELSNGSKIINEAKVILIGFGGVGKTTLNNKLIGFISNDLDDFNISSTRGIKIDKLRYNNYHNTLNNEMTINIWDFGGQIIYHSVHQFFLTKNSLYLLVWDPVKDEDKNNFDYWLNTISRLSDNSPIILIQNKIDLRKNFINEGSLTQKFNNIKSFNNVSAITGEGVKELLEILKFEIEKLPHVGNILPEKWHKIKLIIENSSNNYLKFQDYLNLCNKYGINNESSNRLLQYLCDIGIALYYRKNDLLKDIILINPQWTTSSFYKILDSDTVIRNQGRFSFSELKEILSTYEINDCYYLLELFRKFEFCFKLEDENIYIFPLLLKNLKPNFVINHSDQITYEYHYDYLSENIITRLIVRLFNYIEDSLYWKEGLIINYTNTKSVIESFPNENIIKVSIFGENCRELLYLIKSHIDYIHKSVNYKNFREYIPCNCKECTNTVSPYLFNFQKLIEAKRKGIKNVQCQNSFEDVNLNKILGYYEPDNIVLKEQVSHEINFKKQKQRIKRKKKIKELGIIISILGGLLAIIINFKRIIDLFK